MKQIEITKDELVDWLNTNADINNEQRIEGQKPLETIKWEPLLTDDFVWEELNPGATTTDPDDDDELDDEIDDFDKEAFDKDLLLGWVNEILAETQARNNTPNTIEYIKTLSVSVEPEPDELVEFIYDKYKLNDLKDKYILELTATELAEYIEDYIYEYIDLDVYIQNGQNNEHDEIYLPDSLDEGISYKQYHDKMMRKYKLNRILTLSNTDTKNNDTIK